MPSLEEDVLSRFHKARFSSVWMLLIPCALFLGYAVWIECIKDVETGEILAAGMMIQFIAYIFMVLLTLPPTLLMIHLQWFLAVKERCGKTVVLLLVFDSVMNFGMLVLAGLGMIFPAGLGMPLFLGVVITALPNSCLIWDSVKLVPSAEPTGATMLLQAEGSTAAMAAPLMTDV